MHLATSDKPFLLYRSYRRPSRAPVRGCPIKHEFAEGERQRIYLPQHEPKSEKKAVVPGGLSERKKVERRKRERARERKKGTRVCKGAPRGD